MCPPSSPSYKITGHKYDRYGVDGEHFKIDCVYVVVVALLTACDMMTVNVFLLFFVLFAGNLLVYLNGNPLHIHYIIIHATCSMDVGCGLYARRLLFASHVLHALCGGLEVQKKNVEVKSNAFRSLTSSLNYVKEYTIDMDSSSSATAQQRREGSEAKGKVTYKLTQLKRIHSSYQIRWVWGCWCYVHTALCTLQRDEAEKKERRNAQKMCSVWIALSETKKLLAIYVLLKYCRWRRCWVGCCWWW